MNINWQKSKRKVSPVLWDTLYVYFWPLLVILIVHSIVKVWPRIGWPLLARCVNYGRWQEAEFSRKVPAYTPNTGQEDNNIRRGNYSVSGLRYVPVSGVLQQVAIRWAKIGKNTDLSTNDEDRHWVSGGCHHWRIFRYVILCGNKCRWPILQTGGSVVRSGGGWVVGGISSSRSVFTWGFCCHKYFPARAPCSLYIYKLDQIM